jgi:predicted phage tail protein
LAKIKFHSTLHHLVDQPEYEVNIHTFEHLESYLQNIHPRFGKYIRKIKGGETDETFSYLDKNLKVITQESMALKKLKDDSVVHVVPCITGGGGKRGFLVFAAFVAIGIATGGFGFATAGSTLPSAMTGVGGTTGVSAGGFFASAKASFMALPSFAKSIIGNLALSLLGSLFTKKPKPQEQVDSSTRGSDMFGSLQNTTQSGTPIPLVYGQMRVAGQFISGYLNTTEHGQDTVVKVNEQFND